MALLVLQGKVIRHNKSTCSTGAKCQTIDGACMELELHLFEASGMRKQVFECAFTKRQK